MIFAAALIASIGATAGAHEKPTFSAGEPGDPARAARTITVRMHEGEGKMLYSPALVEVRRGEQIRFVLENVGQLEHEFLLATSEENLKHAEVMQKHPHMAHDEPNARRLAPGDRSEILWRFTRSGDFEFACLIPGHREAGMTGRIIVK